MSWAEGVGVVVRYLLRRECDRPQAQVVLAQLRGPRVRNWVLEHLVEVGQAAAVQDGGHVEEHQAERVDVAAFIDHSSLGWWISGARHLGVPCSPKVMVWSRSWTSRAMPKVGEIDLPGARRMLLGFRSRWRMFLAVAVRDSLRDAARDLLEVSQGTGLARHPRWRRVAPALDCAEVGELQRPEPPDDVVPGLPWPVRSASMSSISDVRLHVATGQISRRARWCGCCTCPRASRCARDPGFSITLASSRSICMVRPRRYWIHFRARHTDLLLSV